MPNRCPRPLAAGLALIAVLMCSTPAAAQPYQWNQSTSGNWSTASWLPGTPASGATTALIFAGSSDYTATNDIGPFTLNSLSVTNTGATTVAGSAAANTLTFAGTN